VGNSTAPAEYCFLWIDWWPLCMTKAEWSGWMQALGAVAAILLAVALPLMQGRRQRRRLRLGYLETVAVDAAMADKLGRTYIRSKVKAPAYRLPLMGLSTALPALIASGELKGGEADTITQFYVDAQSFNFCLDLVTRLRSEQGDWQGEVSRLTLKAEHLVSGGRISRYDEVVRVLRSRLPFDALNRLNIEDDEL
jgi:hypothetical protein